MTYPRLFSGTLLLLMAAVPAAAEDRLFQRAWDKLMLLESGQAKPGSLIIFTPAELNAWARTRLPQMVYGLRDPGIALGRGTGTFSAQVDFLKMRKGEGAETNAMLEKILEGERPLKVTARLDCTGGGICTAHLITVEISGVILSGAPLELLVKRFFLPMFPNAKLNQPFELREHMERVDIRPDGVRVRVKR